MSRVDTAVENVVPAERIVVGRSDARHGDRTGDHDTGVVDAGVIRDATPTHGLRRDVTPTLVTVGRGTLAVALYATCLYVAAIAVGALVALSPGFVGAVLLFTVGIAVIGAAPAVANWVVTRLFELAQ